MPHPLSLSIPSRLLSALQSALLVVLGHASKPLRHTAGTCVVGVAGLAGVASWPQLVGAMAEALDSGESARVEGALDTLYKVGRRERAFLHPPFSCLILVCMFLYGFLCWGAGTAGGEGRGEAGLAEGHVRGWEGPWQRH